MKNIQDKKGKSVFRVADLPGIKCICPGILYENAYITNIKKKYQKNYLDINKAEEFSSYTFLGQEYTYIRKATPLSPKGEL